MKIVEIEIVSLMIAIVSGIAYLIKISLKLKDYFEEIETAIYQIKTDLANNQEKQSTIVSQLKKQVGYLHTNLARLFPDNFYPPDFMDF